MNQTKQKNIQQLAIYCAVLILINVFGSFLFFRLDLTADKRFSLSQPSKDLLNNLEEDIEVKVYLKGDFPAQFEKIESAIADKLQEMRLASKVNFRYRFIDPLNLENDSIQKACVEYITARGIEPMRIFDTESGQKIEKLLFPGAIITYQNREVAVQLVQGNVSLNAEDRIAQSISMLEYELSNGIKMVAQGRRNRIAFVQGHGEASKNQIFQLGRELNKFYDIDFLNLNTVKNIDSLSKYDLISVVKPTLPFSEEDKYKLDQFLMKGGNLSFFIDIIDLRPDSTKMDKIIGVPRELNLTDLLFSYGARVNQTIIQDMQGAMFPIEVSKGNYDFMPNDFSPIITTFSSHPSVKNSGPVMLQNCSTIDTVRADGITKTPLVFTSRYTKVNGGQIYFDVKDFMTQRDETYYNQQNLPVVYLLEGFFKSNFIFKPVPSGFERSKKIAEAKKPGKIILCSDGDLVVNGINEQNGQALPLGKNIYTKEQFANLELASALFDYELDATGINGLRVKDIVKRPLDKIKITEEKTFWQVINIGLPILLITILGLAIYVIRKRKYTRFTKEIAQDNQ